MIMVKKIPQWICCQLGAREHYAIPRAFHREGQLAHLITDAWISPRAILNQLPKPYLANLRERFHPDLEQASVRSFTGSLLRFELAQKVQKVSGWELIIARNNWFQDSTIQYLKTLQSHFLNFKYRPILFAYSYAALKLFRYAKTQGWYTILGQIDPGLVEEKLVLEEHNKYLMYASNWQPAPSCYWNNWQEECRLADRIVVNSLWSSQAIQEAGVPESKIDIIPLAYEPPPQARYFLRTYPLIFSAKRPLRVLFLGQIILRKGMAVLLEAAEILCNQPIEFWLVGSQGIDKPKFSSSQIKWMGTVARSETARYYQQADVFLFPTLSDGFGLTQLEAQAWKLPLIASKFCGKVVEDGVNGLILEEVTGQAIADALLFCLNNPQKLQVFSEHSTDISCFNLAHLRSRFQALPYAVV